MSSNPLIPAFVIGLAYLFAWIGYRYYRYRQHQWYREIHAAERVRRAELKPMEEESLEERLRQARWDAQYGPLLGGMELRNREESRWPIASALQGAATVTASLLIAMLIWNVRGHTVLAGASGAGTKDIGHGSSSSAESFEIGAESNKSVTTTATQPTYPSGLQPPTIGEISGTVALVMLLVGAGVFLLYQRRSATASATGAVLVTVGSLLAGAKLLSIDKLISAKTLLSVQYSPQKVEARKVEEHRIDSISLRLPPFDTGSAGPTPNLECAIATLAKRLGADPYVLTVTVIGRADRRSLRSNIQKAYATNWGLAQQRAEAVATELVAAGVQPSKIIATAAGPLFTADPTDPAALSRDRAASVVVQINGGEHSWSRAIVSGEWRSCE